MITPASNRLTTGNVRLNGRVAIVVFFERPAEGLARIELQRDSRRVTVDGKGRGETQTVPQRERSFLWDTVTGSKRRPFLAPEVPLPLKI